MRSINIKDFNIDKNIYYNNIDNIDLLLYLNIDNVENILNTI